MIKGNTGEFILAYGFRGQEFGKAGKAWLPERSAALSRFLHSTHRERAESRVRLETQSHCL